MQEAEATPESAGPEEKRIADAQERIQRIREQREKLADQRLEGEKAAEIEQEAEDEEAIFKAEQELGERGKKFATVRSPKGVIILKQPNPLKYRQFMDANKFTTTSVEAFILPCRVHPSGGRLDEILKEWPGLLQECADAVVELARGKRKEQEGKS